LNPSVTRHLNPGIRDVRLSPSTANVRLSAVRKMVWEARKNGMIGAEEAANLTEVPNVPQKGLTSSPRRRGSKPVPGS
jgi:hypothetical protein